MKHRFAALSAAILLAALVAAPAATAASPDVVASGLASPRGLAFGPNGTLYVAEAGLGDGSGDGFGMTGAVTAIKGIGTAHASVSTLVDGLPSACEPGEGCVGPDGISTHGNGNIDVIMALSQAGTGLPSPMGRLLKVSTGGQLKSLANVGDHDYAWSTDHQDLAPNDFKPGDSNPYGVLAQAGGAYVVDAGTNTLDWVAANGKITILAYFPNNAVADSTPTCVTRGPDGALYVGTLAFVDSLGSFLSDQIPFPPHPAATVYRVDPKAVDPSSLDTVLSVATPWATGLWPITGCAFGPDGSFYASEFLAVGPQGPYGDVVRIPFAHPTTHESMTGGALWMPGGIAVGPDGHVYVANQSTSPDGEVLRLP